MTGSTTMTIRLDASVKDKLGRLAEVTRRSNSFLAAEAIEAYVARELEIVDMILEGMAAAERGDTVSSEEVEKMLADLTAEFAEKNG